ncbi:MAG: TIGR03943 family protein [bacterium]|nr:TIGR03943 family protein [bacterium]
MSELTYPVPHGDHDHPAHDHDHDHDGGHDHRADLLMLWLKTALLIGLGVYFVRTIVTGSLTNYINERFAWLSYLAAALFLLLGLYSLWIAVRASRSDAALHQALNHDHDHDHDADHTHEQISWGTLAILAIPLLLGTLIPSRPLGAEAISGNLATSASIGATTTFTTQPLDRNVLDWLRYFATLGDYQEAVGQPADVIGFVYKEPTFGDDQFMVARFTVSCCVADASAIGVPVQFADSATLEQGAWVRVRGAFTVGDFQGDTMPVLVADALEPVEQPKHPYLYP